MRFSAILLGGLAVLAGCRQAPAPDRPPERQPAAASSDRNAPPPPARPEAPATGGAQLDASKPASQPPVAAESAEAAAQVVQAYFALLEKGRSPEAARLWEDGGKASAFAADLRRYSAYRAETAAPGEMEGAAGSSFVAIPVRLDGRLKDGAPFRRRLEAMLRRVNDVPGSTEAQRHWRIFAIGEGEAAQ
ncbi:MAG: hypothetical protein QOG84_2620 [Sphingomonadales bacterium]|jgi:hypothetical protein|nr:hypothetical protein [Sphingomonadales bacterium]